MTAKTSCISVIALSRLQTTPGAGVDASPSHLIATLRHKYFHNPIVDVNAELNQDPAPPIIAGTASDVSVCAILLVISLVPGDFSGVQKSASACVRRLRVELIK